MFDRVARRQSGVEKSRPFKARFVATSALVAVALALVALPAPASAYASPAIWVGSPVVGTWGVAGDSSTVPAGAHHRLAKASPANDWAVDLSRIPGTDRGVYLYVAPSNAAHNNKVTTKVLQIIDNQTCRNGGGGDTVTIGVYYNGKLYGRATYAHIDRVSTLKVGHPVSRWGTKLGDAPRVIAQCVSRTRRHAARSPRATSSPT